MMIKKHLKIFVSGALVILPVAVTVWVVVMVTSWLSKMGEKVLVKTGIIDGFSEEFQSYAGLIGVMIIIVTIYLVGLMTRMIIFKQIMNLFDHMMSRLPGIKIIYESTRDLLELFGGEAGKAGYPVLYSPPDSEFKQLGIVTNEHPVGLADGDDSVAVYLPMGYMIGGPIVYAKRDHVEKLDMSVETAMKLAATAFVSKETDN